ncbi:hypothetical protein V1520DRAFT_335622 [Lipomyces starkeyi]|uniref:C2H2-type domain-containing protein n=1 Tax=Lipomyces starkeyi NRRL Y-11557 TaxID=675824 RepID=A0A1E3PV54_LIPST|nr:hypothetical protein LIPSTDRAFT_76072 [Lipomyces starkeyi NRRL Y-11557]
MSAAQPTYWSSLWTRIASVFTASPSDSITGLGTPIDDSGSQKTDVVHSYARFSVFSLVSPLSTGALLASLFSGPRAFASSFLGLIFSAPKRINSKPEPAPAVTVAEVASKASCTNASVTSPPVSPVPAQTASLFPQIILDVRLTAATPARTNSASSSNVQTATPCATDPSTTLFQVHNAGGELVGFDLSDSGMMHSSSSYMLQFAPQVQYQPQQQFVPQFVPLEQQVLTAPPATAVNQGDFLTKLDELELYISEMRHKLAASGTARTSTGFADDGSVPRVVRRRNERQSIAAPYNRPLYPSVPSYALDVNDTAGFVGPSPDQTLQASSELLVPGAVHQNLSSPSTSTASSMYSPAESTTWSPPSLVDDSSPASAPGEDNYAFTGPFSEHIDLHPDTKFFDGNAPVDIAVDSTVGNGKHEHEYLNDDTKFVPHFPPEHMMSFHDMSGFQPQFVPHAHNSSYPLDAHTQFIFDDNQAPLMQAPVPHMADVSSTVSSSPRSSMGSPHRSSVSGSPASSNSSPSSSPGKQHAMVHSPSSSPHQPSSTPTFQCPHCSSKFRIKGYLTRHLKKHAINKAYTCPFFDPTSSTPCHSTGGFSRRDTYKTHLKSRHFVYPAGTRSDQRAGMRGWCAACGMLFACNENWVENHVEGGECRAFHGIPMYG